MPKVLLSQKGDEENWRGTGYHKFMWEMTVKTEVMVVVVAEKHLCDLLQAGTWNLQTKRYTKLTVQNAYVLQVLLL